MAQDWAADHVLTVFVCICLYLSFIIWLRKFECFWESHLHLQTHVTSNVLLPQWHNPALIGPCLLLHDTKSYNLPHPVHLEDQAKYESHTLSCAGASPCVPSWRRVYGAEQSSKNTRSSTSSIFTSWAGANICRPFFRDQSWRARG